MKSAWFIAGVAVLTIGVFILLCSVNALNVYTGKSTLGMGIILYRNAIETLNLEPIGAGLIIGLIVTILGIALLCISCLLMYRKNKAFAKDRMYSTNGA